MPGGLVPSPALYKLISASRVTEGVLLVLCIDELYWHACIGPCIGMFVSVLDWCSVLACVYWCSVLVCPSVPCVDMYVREDHGVQFQGESRALCCGSKSCNHLPRLALQLVFGWLNACSRSFYGACSSIGVKWLTKNTRTKWTITQ